MTSPIPTDVDASDMTRSFARVLDAVDKGGCVDIVVAHGASLEKMHLPGGAAAIAGDIIEISTDSTDLVVAVAVIASPTEPYDEKGDSMRWRRPGRSLSRMLLLQMRHCALRAIREYFDSARFIEIQAPLMIRGTCPDLHTDSFTLEYGYLATSTEYQIKRMIVGGFESIYTISQNFRPNELSQLHNPEFTMLEWARVGASLSDIEKDAQLLVRAAATAVRSICETENIHRATESLLASEWRHVTVLQALQEQLGINVDHHFSHDALLSEAARIGIEIPASVAADREGLVSYLIDLAQHSLGHDIPVFLTDWPSFMTASARLKDEQPEVAERSELVIRGIEISDGFPWICDGIQQAALFAEAQQKRRAAGKPEVVLDNKYIAAIHQAIPPGAGMALGIDRLMMVFFGATNIQEVISFAWDEV